MFALTLLALTVAVPQPVRLSADVDDPFALTVNPAGLGYVDRAETRFLLGRDGSDQDARFGAFGALPLGEGMTLGASVEPGIGHRLALGGAFKYEFGATGFSYQRVQGRHVYNLGVSFRVPWVSFGFAATDLREALDLRRYDFGLAVRVWDERLLVSGSYRTTFGRGAGDDAHYFIGRAQVEALPGLLLGVSLDSDRTISGSLAIRMGYGEVGATVFERDGAFPQVAELVLRAEPLPSLFRRKLVPVLELTGQVMPGAYVDWFAQSIVAPIYGAAPLVLDRLAADDDVAGLFVKIGGLEVGFARAAELRKGLLAARTHGKRVVCLLGAGAKDIDYFVASACDRLVMNPPAWLEIDGISARAVFFGGALKRFGVRPEVVRIGPYKSAPEMFTRENLSAEQKEVLGTIVDHAYESVVAAFADGRRLPRDTVTQLIDSGTLTATQAKASGVIDEVWYPDEVEQNVLREFPGSPRLIAIDQFASERRNRWRMPWKIAVVAIDSAIVGGESKNLPFGLGRSVGADSIVSALRAAELDPYVRAVVLRVDSPGGDAFASDLIARAVEQLGAVKPVIASFGDVAASGGYYAAAPARAIYAEPGSITGSIGVFSLDFSFGELLEGLGIHGEAVTRGLGADRHNPLRPQTEAERAMTEREVSAVYSRFVSTVARGRKMKVEAVREVAAGRVWIGADAKARGLVDEIGGLVEAIRRAQREAQLEGSEFELVVLPVERPGLPTLARTFDAALGTASERESWFELVPSGARDMLLQAWLQQEGVSTRTLALLPVGVEVD